MSTYLVQKGPLNTFDDLFDDRWEKIRNVESHPVIQITGRGEGGRSFMAEYARSAEEEMTFVSGFFGSVIAGHKVLFGIRDVAGGKAGELREALKGQEKLGWFDAAYGVSEDDLIVVELKDFSDNFRFIAPFVRPQAGGFFFYLTRATLAIMETYWLRCARSAAKAKDEPFRRDVIGYAHDAKIVLMRDQDGVFTVVVHPKVELDPIETAITDAGAKAGMEIDFAPGLFG